jgi:hypothetical protein
MGFVPGEVMTNIKVEITVVIQVGKGGRGGPVAITPQAGTLGDVFEGPVTAIAVQGIASPSGENPDSRSQSRFRATNDRSQPDLLFRVLARRYDTLNDTVGTSYHRQFNALVLPRSSKVRDGINEVTRRAKPPSGIVSANLKNTQIRVIEDP